MDKKLQPLFMDYRFNCGSTVKNRIVMAPMTTESGFENGMVTDEELEYYRVRSRETGMIITACAYVTRSGKAFSGQMAADNDIFIPGLSDLSATIHDAGAKAIMQLQHGGGMSDPAVLVDSQPIAPSAMIVSRSFMKKARAMTISEIKEAIDGFAKATKRAILSGFDGVEIHGANHYLLHQFFSQYTNNRTDMYGGSLANRMRFGLEVLQAVIKVRDELKPEFIVGYRISPEEKERLGISVEDTLEFIEEICKSNLDYVHLSTTKLEHKSWKNRDELRTALERVSAIINKRCALIGVGYITDGERALMALKLGADFAAVGRAMLSTPDWTSRLRLGESLANSELFDFSRNKDYLKLPQPMEAWLKSENFKIKQK